MLISLPEVFLNDGGRVMRDGIHRLTHAKKYSRFFGSICVNLAWPGVIEGLGRISGPDPREMAKADLIGAEARKRQAESGVLQAQAPGTVFTGDPPQVDPAFAGQYTVSEASNRAIFLERLLLFEGVTEQVFLDAPKPVNGMMHVPDLPGLGLVLNMDFIREHDENK